MHYGGYDWHNGNGPTIVDKNGEAVVKQRNGFSELDIIGLNKLYSCGKNTIVSIMIIIKPFSFFKNMFFWIYNLFLFSIRTTGNNNEYYHFNNDDNYNNNNDDDDDDDNNNNDDDNNDYYYHNLNDNSPYNY